MGAAQRRRFDSAPRIQPNAATLLQHATHRVDVLMLVVLCWLVGLPLPENVLFGAVTSPTLASPVCTRRPLSAVEKPDNRLYRGASCDHRASIPVGNPVRTTAVQPPCSNTVYSRRNHVWAPGVTHPSPAEMCGTHSSQPNPKQTDHSTNHQLETTQAGTCRGVVSAGGCGRMAHPVLLRTTSRMPYQWPHTVSPLPLSISPFGAFWALVWVWLFQSQKEAKNGRGSLTPNPIHAPSQRRHGRRCVWCVMGGV
jgi:hypothetical protein